MKTHIFLYYLFLFLFLGELCAIVAYLSNQGHRMLKGLEKITTIM
jgi:hypothetical protein